VSTGQAVENLIRCIAKWLVTFLIGTASVSRLWNPSKDAMSTTATRRR
jgi:hypothetical protein